MGKRWFVARTQAGLARIAEAELNRPYGDREAFRTILPIADGRLVFGPYIFIEFDPDADYWEPINSVRGIVRLLPIGCPNPLPLPQKFIEDLCVQMEMGGFNEEVATELVYAYAKGEAVVASSGAWEGHEGKYIRKHRGFVNVSMVLFNRQIEIPIPAHQVRPASPRAA